jgi:hypothetical protein
LHFLLLARLCPFSPQLAQVCSSVDGPDDDACSAMWSAFLKFFAAALNFLLSIYVGRLICLSPLVHEEGGVKLTLWRHSADYCALLWQYESYDYQQQIKTIAESV